MNKGRNFKNQRGAKLRGKTRDSAALPVPVSRVGRAEDTTTIRTRGQGDGAVEKTKQQGNI
jgi:hypothetical protein